MYEHVGVRIWESEEGENTCLYLLASLHHGDRVVARVVFGHTVLADAAGVGAAEDLQGPLVALAGPPLDVPERLHQPVVLELGVLQMGPEVSLTVRHQAGEAGLQGPAGALDAGVAHHIVGAQRFLLGLLFLHLLFSFILLLLIGLSFFLLLLLLLGDLGLLQVLLDLGLLCCLGVWSFLFAHLSLCSVLLETLSRLRLVRTLKTLWTSFTVVPQAGAAGGGVCGGGSCCICHVSRASPWMFHSALLWEKNWLGHFCQFLDLSEERPHLDAVSVRAQSFSLNVVRPFSSNMQPVTHPPPPTHRAWRSRRVELTVQRRSREVQSCIPTHALIMNLWCGNTCVYSPHWWTHALLLCCFLLINSRTSSPHFLLHMWTTQSRHCPHVTTAGYQSENLQDVDLIWTEHIQHAGATLMGSCDPSHVCSANQRQRFPLHVSCFYNFSCRTMLKV